MLGWLVKIYPQRFVRKGHTQRVHNEDLVARWEVGMCGIDWISSLSQQGRAIDLGGSGYPLRFVMTAEVLREALRQEIPTGNAPLVIGDDYATPPGWIGREKINRDALDKLGAAELLAIEAWDLS